MSEKRKSPDVPNTKELGKMYGTGFKLLQRMGYSGGGLGKTGAGITTPVEASIPPTRGEGLGEAPKAAAEIVTLKVTDFSRPEGPMDVSILDAFSGAPQKVTDPMNALVHALQLAIKHEEEAIVLARAAFNAVGSRGGTSEGLDAVAAVTESIYQAKSMNELIGLVSKARDTFDSAPLWFSLDVESLVEARCLELLSAAVKAEGLQSLVSYLNIVQELVLLPDEIPEIVRAATSDSFKDADWKSPGVASALSLARDFGIELIDYEQSCFLSKYLVLAEPEDLINWLPDILRFPGASRWSEDNLIFVLSEIEDAGNIGRWKPLISSRCWRLLLRTVSEKVRRKMERLKTLPTADNSKRLTEIFSWSAIITPEATGYLLSEWFLPQLSASIGKAIKSDTARPALLLESLRVVIGQLRQYCYAGQAEQALLDCIQSFTQRDLWKDSTRPGLRAARFPENSEMAQGRVSMRDILATESAELRLDFAPKPGFKEAGKQVYQFGSNFLYWNEEALYYRDKCSGKWTETSVDSLLAIATKD